MALDLDADEVRLRIDAELLLEDRGLRRLLEPFGVVHPAGSFVLRCMAARHLELYLEVTHLLERDFFVLGGELVAAFAPLQTTFTNTRFSREPRMAQGLRWELCLGDEGSSAWRLTITAMENHAYRDRMGYTVQLEERMTPVHRLHILAILRDLAARVDIRTQIPDSTVWNAVIDHGVCDLHGLIEYLGM